MRHRHHERGVTLIELVVVMVIVAILASVAIPSYRAYVVRSQRSDAKDALLALATAQEKHYLQCNTYGGALGAATDCAGGVVLSPDASKNGWYGLAVDAANATSFTVSATAVSGGNQFGDTECRTFRVTDRGIRMAQDEGGGDTTADCWR